MPAKLYQFTTYPVKGNPGDHGKSIDVANILSASFKDSLAGVWLRMGATCHIQMLQDVGRAITNPFSDRCQVL